MCATRLRQVFNTTFTRLNLFKLHEAVEAKQAKYGSVRIETTYWPVKRTIVYVFNPSDIEKILRAQGKYPYRPAYEFLVDYRSSRPDRYPTVGFGNLQGEPWLNQRLTIAPILLSNSVLKVYLPHLNVIVNDFVDYLGYQASLNNGSVADLLSCTDQFSLESIAMICLNTRLGCLSLAGPSDDGKRLIAADKSLFESFQVLYHGIQWWRFWSTPSYRKFVAAEDTIYNIAGKYVDRAFEELNRSGSLVNDTTTDRCKPANGAMEAYRDDTNCLLKTLLQTKGLEKGHVKTTMIDFMVGGVNPVSASLCFLLHHLAVNPEIQEKLFLEVKSILPQANVDIEETHLSQLPYLKACFKESFRLTTVIPNLVRILPEPITLSDHEIPAGVPIMLSFGAICKHPDHFDEPESFKPERWLGDSRRSIHPFSLLPFGLGNRMCAGRRISEIELYMATAKVILNYRLTSSTPNLRLKQDFIIVPEDSVRIRLDPR